MIKKIAAIVLLSAISILPTISLADVSMAAKVSTSAKANTAAPVIRLASNDVTEMQAGGWKEAEKTTNKEAASGLSAVPPQAWLILTALFCFVMRSSRRTV